MKLLSVDCMGPAALGSMVGNGLFLFFLGYIILKSHHHSEYLILNPEVVGSWCQKSGMCWNQHSRVLREPTRPNQEASPLLFTFHDHF